MEIHIPTTNSTRRPHQTKPNQMQIVVKRSNPIPFASLSRPLCFYHYYYFWCMFRVTIILLVITNYRPTYISLKFQLNCVTMEWIASHFNKDLMFRALSLHPTRKTNHNPHFNLNGTRTIHSICWRRMCGSFSSALYKCIQVLYPNVPDWIA